MQVIICERAAFVNSRVYSFSEIEWEPERRLNKLQVNSKSVFGRFAENE